MRRFGSTIYYGDPARPELLRSAGAAQVKVFVIAIDDVEANLRTVRTIRRLYPDAKVFARARNRRHAWQLMDLGAQVVRETFHSSLVMGERVLVELGLPPEVAAERARRFREHDEAPAAHAVPGPRRRGTRCCRPSQEARANWNNCSAPTAAKACWARSPRRRERRRDGDDDRRRRHATVRPR